MLFNSIEFAIFLPIVFTIFWLIKRFAPKYSNLFIVIVSYYFYGMWDWRFLGLIAFSTIVDYAVGVKLSETDEQSKRKRLLWLSIVVNLGFLGFFKYANFFIDNFVTVFSLFGTKFEASRLNIILPVGISFYTFQTLSYTIDVYNRKLTPTKDFMAFTAFVSFFPQLVAGPIERASSLLPQFYSPRQFNYEKAADGLRQILWGMFKKVVIADTCAEYANLIFNNHADYAGGTLLLGAVLFAFQIYGDFSGYSDIAIGTARLFGFELRQNFAFPYFSRDMAEFWRRWHMSLSTWFRDYLYIPLGGSKGGKYHRIKNTFIIFLVSGFWHGANWTFVFWGGLNALYFLPLLLTNKNRQNIDVVAANKIFPNLRELSSMIITFLLTVIAWVFFRAENVGHAFAYLGGIFSASITTFELPNFRMVIALCLTAIFIVIEWAGRANQYGIEKLFLTKPLIFRWFFYLLLSFAIALFFGEDQQFIYFQF